jgi:hypothetical protein
MSALEAEAEADDDEEEDELASETSSRYASPAST